MRECCKLSTILISLFFYFYVVSKREKKKGNIKLLSVPLANYFLLPLFLSFFLPFISSTFFIPLSDCSFLLLQPKKKEAVTFGYLNFSPLLSSSLSFPSFPFPFSPSPFLPSFPLPSPLPLSLFGLWIAFIYSTPLRPDVLKSVAKGCIFLFP